MNINDMNILVGAEPQAEMTVDLSLSNLNTRERMREKRTSSVLRRFGLSRMSIRFTGPFVSKVFVLIWLKYDLVNTYFVHISTSSKRPYFLYI